MRPLIWLAAVLLPAGADAGIADPVRLDSGLVAGDETTVAGVRVFRGLPFAAPPVGENRWRAPEPVEPWEGVRDASEFGNACIQAETAYTNIANMEGSPPLSEDCLYLNVWTPAQSQADGLPVLVFFYGGGFTDGGGAPPLYDGTALAERGAVVVTMNYRLGTFGFFAHPALSADSGHNSSGNYGIMDMLASLEWVQRNVAAFGGDPGNVTIFGQSAGAMAITALMTSPPAEGLFRRAIAESIMGGGAVPGMGSLARLEQQGLRAAAAAGANTPEELRALSAGQVAALSFRPSMIVDNRIIPEDPALVFADGRQHAVDVLLGANASEMSFAVPGGRGGGRAGDAGPRGADGEAAAAAPQPRPSLPGADGSDRIFHAAWRIAEYQREAGRDAYVYWFTQRSPAAEGADDFLPVHAAEVKYVFDNLGELPLFPDSSDRDLVAASAPDQDLADLMASYWVNFARTGNPNGLGLPAWPAHRGIDSVNAAVLDADPDPATLPTIGQMREQEASLRRALEAAR